MSERLGAEHPASPREAGLAVLAERDVQPPGLVSYLSRGRLLVVGPRDAAVAAAEQLGDRLECQVFLQEDADPEDFGPAAVQLLGRGRLQRLEGHFGAFRPVGPAGPFPGSGGRGETEFDLVLDLGEPPLIGAEVPPIGYFPAGGDAQAQARAEEQLPELVGEFDKPRFFHYEPDICAHSSRGIAGCDRCRDACAAWAIRSIGDKVEVDPYLCQGCGGCASACPSGAMSYALPSVGDLLELARRALRAYRDAGGGAPVVLVLDEERGRVALGDDLASLPEHVLPLVVEDVGSVGPDAWLALLAFGAAQVVVFCAPGTPCASRAEFDAQLAWVEPLLAALGIDESRIRHLEVGAEALPDALAEAPAGLGQPGAFAPLGRKRELIRLAVDQLGAQALARPEEVPLPQGSPFGTLRVSAEACTLCMACVSVCPVGALRGGGDSPELWFHEDVCVQCGICAKACPEDAITLESRWHFPSQSQPRPRRVAEEKLFRCVRCSKPFATEKLIARMQERLQGHWMFEDPEARERLLMCEDCRVRDLLAREGGLESYQ